MDGKLSAIITTTNQPYGQARYRANSGSPWIESVIGYVGGDTDPGTPPRFNGDPYFDIAPVPTSGDMQLRWGPTGTVDAVWSDWSPSQTVLP